MCRRFLSVGVGEAVLMEAQGIEPWSESASSTTSTCVGRVSYRRVGAALRPASPTPSSEKSHSRRRRSAASQPGFAIRYRTPQAGFQDRRCIKRASSAYAAIARLELASSVFPRCFTRCLDLGTQRYLHPTRRNRSPPDSYVLKSTHSAGPAATGAPSPTGGFAAQTRFRPSRLAR